MMPVDTERRCPVIELDGATLTDLVQPAIPSARIVAADLLSGGFVNTNYRVQLAGWDQALVVRLFVRDPAACQKEVDLARLVGSRVPVPEILFADPTGARCGIPYSVATWVEGVKLADILSSGDADAIAGAAYATGATLAAIAAFPFPVTGFFGPGLTIPQPWDAVQDFCPAFIASCLFDGHAGNVLGASLTTRLWAMVTSHRNLLVGIDRAPCLLHADYKAINLLLRQVNGTWSMAAVLDWEFAFAGPPLFDVGILLRDSHALPPSFESQILAALQANGYALPTAWKPITKMLDLMNLCDFLNTPEPRPILRDYAMHRIRETLEEWGEHGSANT